MSTTVLKIGGSLSVYPQKLRQLCAKLSELSKGHKLVVVPGGAEFADTVRCMDKMFNLSDQTAHRMAILGMDQYGLLLEELTPNSVALNQLDYVAGELAYGKLPIFLPAALMFEEDPLENSWDVTSDAIAVYLASRLNAEQVFLVKDVDGIYNRDPKKDADAKLFEALPAADLAKLDEPCVDKATPKLLAKTGLNCYVVNGLFPERIEALLNGKTTTSTKIE